MNEKDLNKQQTTSDGAVELTDEKIEGVAGGFFSSGPQSIDPSKLSKFHKPESIDD